MQQFYIALWEVLYCKAVCSSVIRAAPAWGWVGVTVTGGSILCAEAGVSWGQAEDSWTGSNFGDVSPPHCSIWANCWRSAKEVCCLNLPPSNNLSFPSEVVPPVTISAPSITFGTLCGELTIRPELRVGVLLVMCSLAVHFCSGGSYTCTACCGCWLAISNSSLLCIYGLCEMRKHIKMIHNALLGLLALLH